MTGLHSERRTAIDSIELPAPRIIGNTLAENGFGVQQAAPNVSVLNVFGSFCGQLITHDTGSRINVQRNSERGGNIKSRKNIFLNQIIQKYFQMYPDQGFNVVHNITLDDCRKKSVIQRASQWMSQ